jgi:hypothetical protein
VEEETDGFEGDIKPVGEEDEPPDPQRNMDSAEGHNRDNKQPMEDDQEQPPHPLKGRRGGIMRSGRRIKITKRAPESNLQRGQQWVAWIASTIGQTKLLEEDEIYELFAHCEYDVQDQASDPISI